MIESMDTLWNAAYDIYHKSPVMVGVVWPDSEIMFQAIKDTQGRIANFTIIGDGNKMKAIGESIISPDLDVTIVGTQKTPREAADYAMGWVVEDGGLDLVMKGSIETKLFLQAALNKDKDYNLRTDRLFSHVAVLEIPEYAKLLLISDAGVCIKPTLKQKVDIIQNAIDVAHKLGIDYPTVAVLAANEKVNPDMPESLDAAALTVMESTGQLKDAYIVGPMSFDCAISVQVRDTKGVEWMYDDADILVVPDVVSGNMLAKSIIHFAGGKMAGVVMGAKVPLIVASRAGSVDEQVHSIALGVLLTGDKLDG
ncbi:MAG: phosphate butyryltransferase [Gammaproteobacteria bacterium]|nr:phosphate butyryltransferase [Gammaproteobacteria bacterium]